MSSAMRYSEENQFLGTLKLKIFTGKVALCPPKAKCTEAKLPMQQLMQMMIISKILTIYASTSNQVEEKRD